MRRGWGVGQVLMLRPFPLLPSMEWTVGDTAPGSTRLLMAFLERREGEPGAGKQWKEGMAAKDPCSPVVFTLCAPSSPALRVPGRSRLRASQAVPAPCVPGGPGSVRPRRAGSDPTL